MASRSGSASFTIRGVREVNQVLAQIAKEDLNPAKRDLRQGTKAIANDHLIPALKAAADTSGVPIAPRMADTMRTRTDRFVTVRIGAVNPRLSGFRRGIGEGKARVRRSTDGKPRTTSSQSYRTTLAWGSDRGPYPGADVNHYAVGRARSHWVIRGASNAFHDVKAAYMHLLDRILRDYGEAR